MDELFDNVIRQSQSMQGQKYIQLKDVTVPVPPPDVAPAGKAYISILLLMVTVKCDVFNAKRARH